MSQAAVDITTLLAVIVGTIVVLFLWDRIAAWNDRDIERRINGAATRPLHLWRDTTSLDPTQGRHRANGEES